MISFLDTLHEFPGILGIETEIDSGDLNSLGVLPASCVLGILHDNSKNLVIFVVAGDENRFPLPMASLRVENEAFGSECMVQILLLFGPFHPL